RARLWAQGTARARRCSAEDGAFARRNVRPVGGGSASPARPLLRRRSPTPPADAAGTGRAGAAQGDRLGPDLRSRVSLSRRGLPAAASLQPRGGSGGARREARVAAAGGSPAGAPQQNAGRAPERRRVIAYGRLVALCSAAGMAILLDQP